MIYTSYDMIRDCREDRAEGWRYFASQYVPVIRRILAHYATAEPAEVDHALLTARDPQSSLFHSLEPAPERPFVAELRQRLIAGLSFPAPEIDLDLETAAAALEPLTVVEKQAVWTESMGYSSEEAGAMLRMAPETVRKIRERGQDLLRSAMSAWNAQVLRANGPALGRAAAGARSVDCLPSKTFLDILDGRATWAGRESVAGHVRGCLHCIDHFCRMAEVIELMRGVKPLAEAEAAPYYHLLGVAPEKKGWRRRVGV